MIVTLTAGRSSEQCNFCLINFSREFTVPLNPEFLKLHDYHDKVSHNIDYLIEREVPQAKEKFLTSVGRIAFIKLEFFLCSVAGCCFLTDGRVLIVKTTL